MGTPTLMETMEPELAATLEAMLDTIHAWMRWTGSGEDHVTHIIEPLDDYRLDFRISGSRRGWEIDASDDAMNLVCYGPIDPSEYWIPIEQVGYTVKPKE